MRIRGHLARFERLRTERGRRYYRLHVHTDTGVVHIEDRPLNPGRDGNMTLGHIRDDYEDLVDTRRQVEFDVDDDDLIGINPLKPDTTNVISGEFTSPVRRRVYRCFECGGKLTRRDTRIGIVGIIIAAESGSGSRRVSVHKRCEDSAMEPILTPDTITTDVDNALGLF